MRDRESKIQTFVSPFLRCSIAYFVKTLYRYSLFWIRICSTPAQHKTNLLLTNQIHVSIFSFNKFNLYNFVTKNFEYLIVI